MTVGAKVNYVAGGGATELRPGVITHEYTSGFDGDEYVDIRIDQSAQEAKENKAVETFTHVVRRDTPQANTWHFPA